MTVIGQAPGGPVLTRTVSVSEFVIAFGVWAWPIWREAQDKDIWIEGYRMRIVVGA